MCGQLRPNETRHSGGSGSGYSHRGGWVVGSSGHITNPERTVRTRGFYCGRTLANIALSVRETERKREILG